MPTYCFKKLGGNEVIDQVFSINEVPKFVTHNGKVYERCVTAEVSAQVGKPASTWPMKSKALAVHPTQIREYSEFAEKHGVPTEFDPMGRPEFRSKGHRKKYCELVGATDFDGGYGDPTSERNR